MDERHETGHPRVGNTLSLSGWLFADLLLGLALVFLVSAPSPPPQVIPTPTLVPTTVPTQTAIPTQPPVPTAAIALCLPSIRPGPPERLENSTTVGDGRKVDQNAEIPSDEALIDAFAPFEHDERGLQQRVFLVVSFSHIQVRQAPNDQRREENRKLAYQRSEHANQRLREILPGMFTRVTVTYAGGPFDNGDTLQEGKADFWVWFRNDDCDDQGRHR
ncbi:MAG: hypothetical protein IT305_25345 [Chloroflexi bacterium]|nr:hypothetical protein [Chloroflexota bacterium]